MQSWHRWLPIALVGVVLSLLGFSLWKYLQPSTFSDKRDVIDLLSKIVGGAALLTGLFFTWRNIQITQQTAFNSLKISQETLRASEEARLTERFANAIDQMGSEKAEVRLGAIYSLERIAQQSKTHHWPIMEILSAYLRHKSPRENESSAEAVPQYTTEVQAICKIIKRRRTEHEEAGQYFDLGGTYIGKVDLSGAKLRRANLLGCDLHAAKLNGADLEGADLSSANLQSADLREALLPGADLRHADVSSADLSKAQMQATFLENANLKASDLDSADLAQASLYGADLSFAKLNYANLRAAGLQHATLFETDLYRANLEEANLIGAKLGGVNLKEARLAGARLKEADVHEVDLSGADLTGADLTGADLRGVDLRRIVGLKVEQVRAASYYEKNLLPDHILSNITVDE